VKLFVLYPVIRDSNTMDQWNFVSQPALSLQIRAREEEISFLIH